MVDVRFTSALNSRTQSLLFRTVYSANQRSIYGVVADWCDELTQQLLGQSFPCVEKSVAKVNDQLCPKTGASGSGHVDTSPLDECFKQREIDCVGDGFGGTIGSCRECTLPRDHQDSERIGWISGHTKIGPVLQVEIICSLDQYGIEIRGIVNWIIISRGPNRCVEESWHDQ